MGGGASKDNAGVYGIYIGGATSKASDDTYGKDLFENASSRPLPKLVNASSKRVPSTVQSVMQSNLATKLRAAASDGSEHMVEELLLQARSKGFDIMETVAENSMGLTAVHLAAEHGHTAVLVLLLRAGCNHSHPSKVGDTPLHLAAASGSNDCVVQLVKAKADANAPNAMGEVPLFIAARQGRTECVANLLAMNAEPNVQRARDDCAPIHAATKCGHVSCVRALIDGRAEVDLRMLGGTTALWLACAYLEPEVARALLERGADPKATSDTKQTPLFAAANHGSAEALRALLNAGSDVNGEEQGGCSPLVAAVRASHVECVRELLKHGANASTTFQGMTALAHARIDGTRAIVALLEA